MDKDNKEYVCKYCGKKFKTFQKLGGHISCCELNPNRKEKLKRSLETKYKNLNVSNPIEEHILSCEVCGNEYVLNIRRNKFNKGDYKKTCSNICSHKLTAMHSDLEEKNKKISKSNTGKVYMTLRKTKEFKICEVCGKEHYGEYGSGKYCCKECSDIGRSKNISIGCKGKTGGLRQNAYKKYKSGWYHNIHCDSSYELAFIIYCEEHCIKFERNKQALIYIFENKEYKYYPDFIIDNILYEIKGYENDKAKAKHKQHPEVIYLDKHKMKKYLNYVIDKYGKDFIKLYDKIDKIAV